MNALGFIQACGRAPNVMSQHQQPTDIRTWADSTLRVAGQRSNWLGQRIRPTSERLAGQPDCHTTILKSIIYMHALLLRCKQNEKHHVIIYVIIHKLWILWTHIMSSTGSLWVTCSAYRYYSKKAENAKLFDWPLPISSSSLMTKNTTPSPHTSA